LGRGKGNDVVLDHILTDITLKTLKIRDLRKTFHNNIPGGPTIRVSPGLIPLRIASTWVGVKGMLFFLDLIITNISLKTLTIRDQRKTFHKNIPGGPTIRVSPGLIPLRIASTWVDVKGTLSIHLLRDNTIKDFSKTLNKNIPGGPTIRVSPGLIPLRIASTWVGVKGMLFFLGALNG
jgi:hypothetical protein